jgi:hypothetical protein
MLKRDFYKALEQHGFTYEHDHTVFVESGYLLEGLLVTAKYNWNALLVKARVPDVIEDGRFTKFVHHNVLCSQYNLKATRQNYKDIAEELANIAPQVGATLRNSHALSLRRIAPDQLVYR